MCKKDRSQNRNEVVELLGKPLSSLIVPCGYGYIFLVHSFEMERLLVVAQCSPWRSWMNYGVLTVMSLEWWEYDWGNHPSDISYVYIYDYIYTWLYIIIYIYILLYICIYMWLFIWLCWFYMYVKFTTCSWLNHVKSTMESHHFLLLKSLVFHRPGTYDLVRKNCWGSREWASVCSWNHGVFGNDKP